MEKDSIIELNRDMEPFVIQASRPRSRQTFNRLYEDKYTPLCFVHLSDIHNVPELWERMVNYINHYSQYISCGVHTGDYCGGNQDLYTDMYLECTACDVPILNCVGNHDCVHDDNWSCPAEKKVTHSLLFNHTDNWNVNFMDCEYPMSYYKDFAESNIRLVVLDLYYNIHEARLWLSQILDEALDKGLHVVTAMHEPTDYIVEAFDTTFHHRGNYEDAFKKYEADRDTFSFDIRCRETFEDIIEDFIKKGGCYVCNLAGHDHIDSFGYTERGVLNVVVENATDWDKLGESNRIKGTRSYDCFNVVSIDTELYLLKLIRIGNNVDHYMREKKVLCFNYKEKKIVYSR